MARIAGVDLPRNKRMEIALTYIYGIGRTKALVVLEAARVDPAKKSDELTDAEINSIRGAIDQNVKVEACCSAAAPLIPARPMPPMTRTAPSAAP